MIDEVEAVAAAPRPAQEGMVLSVIVPARNEEATVPACIGSLAAQSEPGWLLGTHWELLVVDDDSRDRTAEQVRAAAGARLISARTPRPKAWTGKTNACWTGAEAASGRWLLFTDADTVHQPGSLSRSVVEAERYAVAMLSYWPRQVPAGLLERAVLPLVYSELATAYPERQVNDPEKRIAMASGQFLLVRADAYRAMGGHAAVAASLVEDVDLAFQAKRGKAGLRYRYASEMVETRSAGGALAFWRGWVKSLALLINNALALALWRVLDVALIWGLLLLALLYPTPYLWVRAAFWLFWLRTLVRVYRRAARSHAPTGDVLLSMVLGLPVFAALLYTSWYRTHILRRVFWKGRECLVERR